VAAFGKAVVLPGVVVEVQELTVEVIAVYVAGKLVAPVLRLLVVVMLAEPVVDKRSVLDAGAT
jgi:hypothetical protein